jgi:hypothetical protein
MVYLCTGLVSKQQLTSYQSKNHQHQLEPAPAARKQAASSHASLFPFDHLSRGTCLERRDEVFWQGCDW